MQTGVVQAPYTVVYNLGLDGCWQGMQGWKRVGNDGTENATVNSKLLGILLQGGFGLWVQGQGFRMSGSGLRVSELRIWGLSCAECGIEGVMVRHQSFFRAHCAARQVAVAQWYGLLDLKGLLIYP